MNLSTCELSSRLASTQLLSFDCQEFAGGEFYFATIEEFEIAIDIIFLVQKYFVVNLGMIDRELNTYPLNRKPECPVLRSMSVYS